MTSATTIGEHLIAALARRGVDTVFGIPGVHTLEMYRGLARSGIRHVLPRHEQGAAFAADGYARISGRPGVCLLISGPGLGNAVTALGQSYSDSVPVLALSSVCAGDTLGKGGGALHELPDQAALGASVTGFSATPMNADELDDALAGAFDSFSARRPRPAHVQIPIDVLAQPSGRVPRDPAPARPPRAPDASAAGRAAALLREARSPVVIAGGGAIGAGDAMRAIAEAVGAAIVTTVAAKGVVAHEHPLHLGATLPHPAVVDLLHGADVVLAAGTELAETDIWSPGLPIRGRIIRIDLDPARLADRHPSHLGILADARTALEAIARVLGALPRRPVDHADLRLRACAPAGAKARAHMRALKALRRALPPAGAVFTDMTQIAYTGNAAFAVSAPRSWFHPSGFGTLGYALPAAIGGKIAAPDRPVAALAGDYGFQFTSPELATAAQERLALPVIVWNNDALGQIADDMKEAGIEAVGVAARCPDLALLARAHGCESARAEDPIALEDAVRRALERPAPTVIEVRESDFLETA